MEQNGKIIIDFRNKDYSDAFLCKDSDLVNQFQMDKLLKIVDEQIEKSRRFSNINDNYYDISDFCGNVHNTISIFGNRGAGKTTFLLTALYNIKQKYEREIIILPVLDPSKLDCKQHPFISIIATIHELVDVYTCNDGFNNASSFRSVQCEYNDAYKRLLKGLPFIDGVGNNNSYQDWDDDLYVSMQGMQKAEASNNLVNSFRRYVYSALRVLNKKCFVIPFDDIDTNINKGFEVLEVIRKYLVTEQIIPILTGDLDLYSKLVRKASWKSFDLSFLKKDCEYSGRSNYEFSHMIDHLENQYLLKILKPENRIHLRTIKEIVESQENDIVVCIHEEQDSIYDCYRKILDNIGFNIQNLRVINQIIYFLEGLSMRTQMRLLKLLYNYPSASDKGSKNAFIREFVNIFWTDIKQKSLDAKSLVNDDRFYPVEMVKFLLDTRSLNTCSDFMPHTNDDILNKALLAISAQFTKQANKLSFMMFDYWVRVCYIRYVIGSFDEENIAKVNEFKNFTSILEHDDLTKCMGLAEAYRAGIYKSLSIPYKTFPGTMIIQETSLEYQGDVYYSFLGMISHETIDQSNKRTKYVSIYKLFALIRDFLFNNIAEDFSVKSEENSHIFPSFRLLRKISQLRAYLEPGFSQESYNEIFNPSDDSKMNLEQNYLPKWYILSKELIAWNKAYSKNELKDITPQLLNRIFTRTFFSMINIDDNAFYVNLGQKMSAYIIAFLNSVLVECFFNIKNEEGVPIIIDNTGDIDEIFRHNFTQIKNHTGFHLLKWLWECPLLKLFIDPIYYQMLLDDSNNKISSSYKERHIYYRLQTLHDKLDSYEKLSAKLIEAVKWAEDLQMKINTVGHERPSKLLFSLYPLEESIMYLDVNMSNNMVFSRIEKISLMIEKVGLLIYTLKEEIKRSDSLYHNVYKIKMRNREKNADASLEFLNDDFFSYLCKIKVK